MQNVTVHTQPGPARSSYEALKDQTGPLNTSTAVVSTKYLCQVPNEIDRHPPLKYLGCGLGVYAGAVENLRIMYGCLAGA